MSVWVMDGTTLRHYYQRAEVGSGTSLGGYDYDPGSVGRFYGGWHAGLGGSDLDIFGWAAGDDIPTASEVMRYYDDVQTARGLAGVSMAGLTPDHIWTPTTASISTNSVASGEDLDTFGGTLSLVSETAETWGWDNSPHGKADGDAA